jgi:hypothetical protein
MHYTLISDLLCPISFFDLQKNKKVVKNFSPYLTSTYKTQTPKKLKKIIHKSHFHPYIERAFLSGGPLKRVPCPCLFAWAGLVLQPERWGNKRNARIQEYKKIKTNPFCYELRTKNYELFHQNEPILIIG